MSPIVVARGLSYSLPNGRELFRDLHFSLGAGVTALVGPNGVGKTCLARILAGQIESTAGALERAAAITLLAQREPPEPVSVAEHLSADREWSLASDELLRGIGRASLCTALSGGEWMRVRLARALGNGYLILDEPTNDLDRAGRAVVAALLREHAGGVLLISHDRECLELSTDVLELTNRGLARYGGGWRAYVEQKQAERARQAAALERKKRERGALRAEAAERRARQERRNRRGAASAERKGAPRVVVGAQKRRAEVTSGAIEAAALARAERGVEDARAAFAAMKLEPVMYGELLERSIPAQKLVAEASGFNVRFDDWIYADDLSFAWRGNVRVAITGGNGAGKSTLVKAVLGTPLDTRGALRRGELDAVYLDQRLAALDDGASVLDNVRDTSRAGESEIRNGLAKFLFAREAVFQRVGDLSGGERLRAALAKAFLGERPPELMVLDEPTNNLDLANVEFLEQIVSGFRGALLVVSHDERFVSNCGLTEELSVRGTGRP